MSFNSDNNHLSQPEGRTSPSDTAREWKLSHLEVSDQSVISGHCVPHIWNPGFQYQNTLAPPLTSTNLPTSGYHSNGDFNSSALVFDSYNFPSSNATIGDSNAALQLSNFSWPNFASNSTTTYGMNSFGRADDQPDVATSANVFAPAVNGIVTANANTNRLKCNYIGCNATFARAGDLRRHYKKHLTPEYPCLVNNCGRRGDRAFYRLDKLRDHQRMKHRMMV